MTKNRKGRVSLEERYKNIFPNNDSDDIKQDETFWLAQPPAQKIVDSITTNTTFELPDDKSAAD